MITMMKFMITGYEATPEKGPRRGAKFLCTKCYKIVCKLAKAQIAVKELHGALHEMKHPDAYLHQRHRHRRTETLLKRSSDSGNGPSSSKVHYTIH